MARQKPVVRLRTYGIYSKWDSDSKELPDFMESTIVVPARVDIEFGMVVNITGGKNLPLTYCIDHPGIRDDQGKVRAPFEGVVHIKTNDWDFFLGDTIWEPIADKIGPWRMYLELNDRVVAEKTFEVVSTENQVRLRPKYKWTSLKFG